MRLVSFQNSNGQQRLGLIVNEQIYDMQSGAAHLGNEMPSEMNCFLKGGEPLMDGARKVEAAVDQFTPEETVTIISPIPKPTSCRDAYAFRQHVATARQNRGVEMIPEFDQFPVFYFTNHNSIIGPGDLVVELDHLEKLDFELEAAIVIGRKGKNITAAEADDYIAGFMIMNDFSARRLQMEEMRLNLGPAKGKDFATSIGPWMVTPDELEPFLIKSDQGNRYDLRMQARHNGTLISDGNLKDMNWTFAEIIERCSYGVELYPGDVIGSGTVGTGCYLELNGSRSRLAKEKGEEYTPVWLQDGDSIELDITGLGKLKHKIVYNNDKRSILAKKKQVLKQESTVA